MSKQLVFYLSLSLCIGIIAGMMIRRTTAQTFGQAIVLASCGSGITFVAGTFGQLTVDTAGKLCVNQ